jgi:hypothetical protein
MRLPILTLALLPFPLSLLSLQAAPVKFESEVLPFLEKKCVECHRAPHEDKNGKIVKPKAGLRMDAAWAITAGSEDGAVLQAGDASKSELYLRVTLPTDDDDFMPPQGKADPLTPAEVDLFKRWINEGADFGAWVGSTEGKPAEKPSAKMEEPGAAPAGAAPADSTPVVVAMSETQKTYTRLSEGLALPDEKILESVTTAGGRVMPLAQTSPLLSVDFRLAAADAKDDAILAARVLAANIAHLDLSRTSATDAALALVSDTPRLVRLDLSNTAIGDEGLKQLGGLKELRYLNLHGTAVTDAGLESLKALKQLEAVYLWQSKVTEEGAKNLRTALPDARIISK